MKSKIVGIGLAALATVLVASPSFAQRVMQPNFQQPGAAAPAPNAGGGGNGQRGIAPQRNAGPRAGNRGAFVGGGSNNTRQGWNGRRDGYRGGGGYRGGVFGGGVYFGGSPYYDAPAYAYDDDAYVDEPAAVGGDVDYCIRRFKSYDVRSGTYLGFDGQRHACP
jgi:hypothetical protein